MSRFLFVHGVYHGPECWDEVVQRLRGRGHECHAVALRGHGPDDRRDFDFDGVGYGDYLDDVRQSLDRLGDDTILVGHSLGGMLVRSLIAEREVEGAVLLCMPTPASLRRGSRRISRTPPGSTGCWSFGNPAAYSGMSSGFPSGVRRGALRSWSWEEGGTSP